MKAICIEAHGGPEVLREIERPAQQLGPNDARLQVRAVALNHLDLWVRRGVPGHRFPLPLVPGCDIAARVVELGEHVDGWHVGDQVLVSPGSGCGHCPHCHAGRDHLCRRYGIFGETRDGGCCEEMVIDARHLLAIPSNLSIAEAAAVPLTLLTAWHMVVERAELRPGETVLVQAAASGVSIMAIQIAKIFGGRVIATAGSPQKAALARELGADDTILYREVDFAEELRRITGKRGVDVILDHIGAETFDRDVRSLAKGGRLVLCGATSSPEAQFDLRHLFFKGLSILGSTMGGRGELDEAMTFVASGKIRPVLDRVFRMGEVRAAHAHLEARQALGKVVVAGFGVDPAELTARP